MAENKRFPNPFAILNELDQGYMQNSFKKYTTIERHDRELLLAWINRESCLFWSVGGENRSLAEDCGLILDNLYEENCGNFDVDKVREGLVKVIKMWREMKSVSWREK
jgi:hypothetical protein